MDTFELFGTIRLYVSGTHKVGTDALLLSEFALSLIHISVENCAGRVAACDCSPCPPGVPVVMPGERIDGGTAAALRRYGVRAVCVLPLF